MAIIPWNACTQEPFVPLRWIECHPGTAVWVQTGLTIVAVLVAIGVPLFIRFLERNGAKRERTERSNQFIQNLLPYVAQTALSFAPAKSSVKKLMTISDGQFEVTAILERCRVDVPPQLVDALLRMHDFDPTITQPVAQAISDTAAYNVIVNRYLAAARGNFARFESVRQQAIPSMKDHLEKMERTVELAIAASARMPIEVYDAKVAEEEARQGTAH